MNEEERLDLAAKLVIWLADCPVKLRSLDVKIYFRNDLPSRN